MQSVDKAKQQRHMDLRDDGAQAHAEKECDAPALVLPLVEPVAELVKTLSFASIFEGRRTKLAKVERCQRSRLRKPQSRRLAVNLGGSTIRTRSW